MRHFRGKWLVQIHLFWEQTMYPAPPRFAPKYVISLPFVIMFNIIAVTLYRYRQSSNTANIKQIFMWRLLRYWMLIPILVIQHRTIFCGWTADTSIFDDFDVPDFKQSCKWWISPLKGKFVQKKKNTKVKTFNILI